MADCLGGNAQEGDVFKLQLCPVGEECAGERGLFYLEEMVCYIEEEARPRRDFRCGPPEVVEVAGGGLAPE